jgi:SHS2 domain-containing protein
VFRFLDHTGELALELTSETVDGVFAEAVAALGELLCPPGASRTTNERREIAATARDVPALLVAWLEEILFAAETSSFVPVSAATVGVATDAVRGVVEGFTATPRPLVKAVTYHALDCAPVDGGWRAHVVLDV